MKRVNDFITSMRPKQWVKNCFVFAGLIFSKSFLNPRLVLVTIYAFLLFCAVSSAVYIINDVIDRDKDRHHPSKCRRPIAAGRVKPGEALVFASVLALMSFTAAFFFNSKLLLILLAYFLLVLSYSLKLKNVVILDVILIAAGFVLRTVGGSIVIGVWISPWLILCTTLLALFLALNKRKNELLVLSEDAASHRKILEEYTPELIDGMLSVITSTTLMSYALYTFSAGKSSHMMLTIPFVLYGIFRYQYLVASKDMGGSPELVVIQDKPMLVNILLWIAASILIILFS